ncbi:MAG: hypothetical protein FWC42_08235 [Proteobacteria bacterium]|nr:hypothetical protein [Pseudomonadota bacterium]
MKNIPRLHVALRRSRRTAIWFAAPTLATALLLWTLPWLWWALLIADLVLVVWACWMWRRLMPQGLPGGVEALTLSADRQLRLYFATGFAKKTAANASAPEDGPSAQVLDSTCLGDTFLTLVWRSEASHRLFRRKPSRTLFLLPDMMSADDWRRLRILLQHGRQTSPVQESGI